MPQINEAVATETPVAAPAATPEPKATAPKAAKAVAKPSANGKPKAKAVASKTPAKQAPKAAPTKTEGGLRKPQVRILAALNKSGKPLDRKTISAKAPVDTAACVEYIGSHDEDVRKANDKKHFPSLISLGFVRFANNEDAGAVLYEITGKGKQALAKAEK